MVKELLRFAKKAAKQEDIIYAPDEAAFAWMNRFSEMVRISEREKCAQVCDELGAHDAAKKIREMSA